MKLTTRDEIFSSMVVYGFLNFENGKVSIPNKELMDKFDNSKWADLSEDERMDFVEQAVSKIADILSLNEIPEVMYFEDDPSNCGYYYSGL